MNIALLPSAFHPSLGGVEELTRQLGLALVRQGHRVIVITNRWPRDLPEREMIDGLDVYRLPMRFPGECVKSHVSYYASRGLVRRRLAAILWAHDVDLLHVQCVSAQAHYATWAARRVGRPLIVTLQGELTMDATRLYQRSERARRLMRETLNSATAITACSQQTLDEAGAFLGRPWTVPASVILNGVNVEELANAEPFRHDRPYMLAIGRHVPQKGFDVLLRAFAQYVRAGGALNLILAGDGPESATLQKLSIELGLEGRAHLVGRTDRPRTASLFAGCEFFVLPSRHEPFGIVNLEAMAAGKAVVATRVGGVPEIVQDGVTGILVPADDERALSAAIHQLSETHTQRDRLAVAGCARAARNDWNVVAERYTQEYISLRERPSSALTTRSNDRVSDRAAGVGRRNQWWDIVRGVCIILIVVGHVLGAMRFEERITWAYARQAADVLLLAALAGFYAAAGAFLPCSSRRSFSGFIFAKARTLLVPYVVWTLLQGGTESLLSRYVVPDRSFPTLLKTMWYEPYWQFWFLYVLFISSLLAWPLVRGGLPRWSWLAIAVIVHVAMHCGLNAGWNVGNRALADFLFVAFGMACGTGLSSLGRSAFLQTTVGATALAGVMYVASTRDFAGGWASDGVSVSGLAGIIAVATILNRSLVATGFAYIGRHSLAIFVTHVFIIGGCKVIISRLAPSAPAALILAIRCSLGVGLPLLALELLARSRAKMSRTFRIVGLQPDHRNSNRIVHA